MCVLYQKITAKQTAVHSYWAHFPILFICSWKLINAHSEECDIFLISLCLMHLDSVTLTLHLRAESTSYACNTHRPAAQPQELKSIYTVFLAVPALFFSSVFFCFLSFPPSFSSSKSHLWLPAERGVEKVNFSVGLICYAWPVSVSTCPSFDTGWQSARFICPGAVSQTAIMGFVVNTETAQSWPEPGHTRQITRRPSFIFPIIY